MARQAFARLLPSAITAIIGVAGIAITYQLFGSFMTSEEIKHAMSDLDKARIAIIASTPAVQSASIGAGKTRIAQLSTGRQPTLISIEVIIPQKHYNYRCILAAAHDGFGATGGYAKIVSEICLYDGTDADQNRLPYGFPTFSISGDGWLVATTTQQTWPVTGATVNYGVIQFAAAK
jgi:hypothetical protein